MLNSLRGVFRSFQDHDVRYVVIGGIAAILHGVPRATFGLDILIEATEENAERLLKALLDAGVVTAALTTADNVLANEITVFKDFVRIGVQTSTPGLTFARAWANKITAAYEGQQFHLVSRSDLIASKSATGRQVDFEDIRVLGEIENKPE